MAVSRRISLAASTVSVVENVRGGRIASPRPVVLSVQEDETVTVETFSAISAQQVEQVQPNKSIDEAGKGKETRAATGKRGKR